MTTPVSADPREDFRQALLSERAKDTANQLERSRIQRAMRDAQAARIRGEISHLMLQLAAKEKELREVLNG